MVDSLERIRAIDCSWIVPGHGYPVEREAAEEHIDHHIAEIRSVEELLVDRLKTAHSTEQAIALVSGERGLSDSPAAYWLAVTTVKGYLGELLDRGALEFFVSDHTGWWRTVG